MNVRFSPNMGPALALASLLGAGSPACFHARSASGTVPAPPQPPSIRGPGDEYRQPPVCLFRFNGGNSERVQTYNITDANDPCLGRAHYFLANLANSSDTARTYEGRIETLETIQYHFRRLPGTYRWEVFIDKVRDVILGVSVSRQIPLPGGRTFTVIDYHTPAERGIYREGHADSTAFPACPESERHVCVVQVRDAAVTRGYAYYQQQNFRPVSHRGARDAWMVLYRDPHRQYSIPEILTANAHYLRQTQ